MKLADGCHLTYCTSIHGGESWADLRRVLEGPAPAVRRRVSPDRPFGLGLRVSQACAAALGDRANRAELKRLLAANDLYVFTLNGFPYGAFHRAPVKEAVYRPDWSRPERLSYSNALAELLADLLPAVGDVEGSVSTVPLGQRGCVDAALAADLLLRHVAHLVRLREATGRTVALALEPEPGCELEETGEAVRFIERQLLNADALRRVAALTGLTAGAADEAVRRHVGLCLDLCHAAVRFEDPDAIVDQLVRAGIRIVKMQVTAGLRARAPDDELRRLFAPFNEDIYLHQVGEKGPWGRRSYRDLPDALSGLEASGQDREWRVHYHVPVFEAGYGLLSSTHDFVEAVLRRHARQPLTAHLEVETYTWTVLPAECRKFDAVEVIARELQWVREHIGDDAGCRA